MKIRHVMAVVVALAGCAAAQPSPESRGLTGKVAPDFTAERPDGRPFRFSSLRGRVVVLDLWASWCPGCKEKLPALDAMAARLRAAGIETLAVSLDTDREAFRSIIDKRTWQMTPLFDSTERVGDLYQPSELPAIFVIDSKGIIVESVHGYSQTELPGLEDLARNLGSGQPEERSR